MARARHAQRTPDAAFDAFFRATYPRAVAVARRVTGGQAAAEDAAIEAMAKAHARWRRLRDEPGRASWVLKVAANEAIRRRPRQPAVLAEIPVATDPAEQVAVRQTLGAALRALPPRQREVLVLRYLVGLSETEVASTLAVSHGTVKTHLRRGLAALRTSVDLPTREEWHAELA